MNDDEVNPLFRWLAPLVAIVLAVALHSLMKPLVGEYGERIAIDCCIAVVLAVSLNIVNGYTGQFSIGHAAFYAIGGYTAACVTYYAMLLFDSANATENPLAYMMRSDVLFVFATLVGGVVAALAGWLVGLPSLRLRGDYLAVVTLGFGEILRVLLQQTNKQLYTRDEVIQAGVSGFFPPPVGGALGFINVPKHTTLFWAALAAGVTLVVAWRLKKSTFGRSMIAIRENEIAAESMGVNVTRLKVWAFVFAAFFAGIAGSLYAHQPGQQLSPSDGGFVRSFDVIIMVVLGGLGSISGAVLAAILLTVANEWLRDPTPIWHFAGAILVVRLIAWPHRRARATVWWVTMICLLEATRWAAHHFGFPLGEYRMIVYALALVLMMILRPGGFFGINEVTDLLQLRKKQPNEINKAAVT